jgi:hypothetical protein
LRFEQALVIAETELILRLAYALSGLPSLKDYEMARQSPWQKATTAWRLAKPAVGATQR